MLLLAIWGSLLVLLVRSRITGRRRVFLAWMLVLSAVWLLANRPRNLGTLKAFLGEWAGFPWTFAHWQDGRLTEFDPLALVGDVVVGAILIVLLAGLCAWSRRRSAPSA
ncbi:MAG: hypothetical protein U0736_02620 [Gemmataceae bacterium]